MQLPQGLTLDQPAQGGLPPGMQLDNAQEQDKPIPILEGYQRAGRILKHAGSDIASSIGGMADMFSGSPVTGPLKLGAGITGRYMDAYKGAKDAAQRGDTTESMFKSVAVPFAPIGADEIYDDAKSGDNEKAAGKGISRILQVAGPELLPRAAAGMPKFNLPEGGDLAAKATATGKLLGREVSGHVPILNRFESLRKPTFSEYADALRAKADPQLSLYKKTPKLGDSPLFSTADVQPTAEGTAAGPVEAESVSPITSPLRAKTPKGAQTEILRKAGVASPAATIKPMTRVPNADITPRADLKFSGSHSGEEAAMNQLTENVTPDRLGINELRGIAQQRGIKVSPGDSHVALYRKIQDSLTPEEIEQFDQARIERMQPDYSLPPISRAGEQGGHAGNGVSSVEELSRPGTNYVVSKSGQLTYHGKSFAPEGIPAGSSHVTALPDGTLRVNAGTKLTEAQEMTLRKAIPETEPRVPVSDADQENLLMRSIQRAKSAKAGD